MKGKKLYVVISSVVALLPLMALAAGLVPCGGTDETPCQFCHVVSLIMNVSTWLVGILTILVAIVFILAGLRLVTSVGNVSAMTDARNLISNTFIGFSIVLLAWVILGFILRILIGSETIGSVGTLTTLRCVDQPEAHRVSLGRYSIELPDGGGKFGDGSGSGTLGSCVPATSGPCSEEALRAAGFGDLAGDAALIAGAESGCNPNAESRTDTTTDGRTYSVGLWQINLAVHDLNCSGGRSLKCSDAFKKTNLRNKYNVRMYEVINEDLYTACVRLAKDATCNSETAARLARASGDMGDWACSARKCGVKTSRNHLCPL